ncbi:hypothetical protein MMC17_009056 [Xylographa soralifera]|nr:hypothetical protein [Xylographa soralifera]
MLSSPYYAFDLSSKSVDRLNLHAFYCLPNSRMQTSPRSTATLMPTRPASTVYYHTGIGGAGNYHKHCVDANMGPSPRHHNRVHFSRSIRSFFGGLGGGGNIHAMSSIDAIAEQEEAVRVKARDHSYTLRRFVGIGGAGNRTASRMAHDKRREVDEGASAHSGQALPFGAADALKWRMGAVLGRKKFRDDDSTEMERAFIKSLQDGTRA